MSFGHFNSLAKYARHIMHVLTTTKSAIKNIKIKIITTPQFSRTLKFYSYTNSKHSTYHLTWADIPSSVLKTQYDCGLIQNADWKNILYFNTYFIFYIIDEKIWNLI